MVVDIMKKHLLAGAKAIGFFALWVAGVSICSLPVFDKLPFLEGNAALLRLWWELMPLGWRFDLLTDEPLLLPPSGLSPKVPLIWRGGRSYVPWNMAENHAVKLATYNRCPLYIA